MDEPRRLTREELARAYAALGIAPAPAQRVVESELQEDFPQLAMAVLCLSVWRYVHLWHDDLAWIDRVLSRRHAGTRPLGPIVTAMLEAGITREQLGELARFVAQEQSFAVLSVLDDGGGLVLEEAIGLDLPGWALEEVAAGGDETTGRRLEAVAETFFPWDPQRDPGLPGWDDDA